MDMPRQLKRLVRQIVPLPVDVVLLDHRVAYLETDSPLLSAPPHNFAEHLEVLRRNYLPIWLGELGHRKFTSLRCTRRIALTIKATKLV